jgi:hypothetical protein
MPVKVVASGFADAGAAPGAADRPVIFHIAAIVSGRRKPKPRTSHQSRRHAASHRGDPPRWRRLSRASSSPPGRRARRAVPGKDRDEFFHAVDASARN